MGGLHGAAVFAATILTRLRRAPAAALLLAACLLSGGDRPAEAAEGASAGQGASYVFGVPPWQRGQSVDDIRRLYRPMLDYLQERIGARITLVSSSTYEDMIDYLATGRVHFGTISPRPYIQAKARNGGIELLLTELSWTPDRTARTDSYRGLIVALKSRDDLRTLADLRGRRFAFVTAESTSGFRYPAAILRNAGIDHRRDFAESVFVGSHPRVTDAIAAGSVDAGATWDFNQAQAIDKHGDVFKTLAAVAIPNLCIAAHPSMPPEIRAAIRAALLSVDPTLLEGLPTAGYVERPDSFYDVVRSLPDISP